MVRHSSLAGYSVFTQLGSELELTLMHGEIAAVAEHDSIAILTFRIITDRTG